MAAKEVKGRSRGLSSPAVPLTRGDSFSDSNKGISLSHSLSQITNFMSTSFPSRGKRDDKSTPSPEVATLKEEFERKIAAVVFCLEEKAEENIDLSYKLKALQQTSKQREAEKDRIIEDLQKAIKSKEEEFIQLEKKAATDDVLDLNELNRRIQTLTHCLNVIRVTNKDMAEENLRLRTTVNANTTANGKTADEVIHDSLPDPFSPRGLFKRKNRNSKNDLKEFYSPPLTTSLNVGEEKFDVDATRDSNRNSKGPGGSPFSPPPPHSTSFSMDPQPSSSSSASFLSSLTASSSILSVSRSASSPNPLTSAPSTLSAPSSSLTSSSSKGLINTVHTTSVSTNTSPVPSPAQAPPIKVVSLPAGAGEGVSLPSDVADMKSEVLAEELLKDPDWLKRFCDSYLVPPPPSQSLTLLGDIIKQDKSKSEAKIKLSLDDKIKELESMCTIHEDLVVELKTKLAHETNRTGSLGESVVEYEKKLKELEGRMWDNLNKEAQRRSDAESKAKRLKKKVDELQFLLDELKDDGSDEDEDDDEPANDPPPSDEQ